MNTYVTRKARQTGLPVTVASADALGLDEGRWYTVCETHHAAVGHETLRLANYHAADPAGWCEECRTIIDRAAIASTTVPFAETVTWQRPAAFDGVWHELNRHGAYWVTFGGMVADAGHDTRAAAEAAWLALLATASQVPAHLLRRTAGHLYRLSNTQHHLYRRSIATAAAAQAADYATTSLEAAR